MSLYVGMRSVAILTALAAVSGVAAVAALAAGGASGEPAPAAFRLADGSAGCVYADGRVACRSSGEPAATAFARDGRSYRTDAAVGWSEATPVLLAAEAWWHGGFVCRVGSGRILCAPVR